MKCRGLDIFNDHRRVTSEFNQFNKGYRGFVSAPAENKVEWF